MGQVNVNTPGDSGGGSSGTGLNLAIVLIVLLVALVVLWLLFAGPVGWWGGNGETDITVNPPAQEQPANPGQPSAPTVQPSVPTVQPPAATAAPKTP